MAKFATNVSGAILLPGSIQVTESISGSVVPLAMFKINAGRRIIIVDCEGSAWITLYKKSWQL